MAVHRRSGPAHPATPQDPTRYDALIESLGLDVPSTWAACALAVCLKSLAFDDGGATVVEAALRGEETFVVVYRRIAYDMPSDRLMGTVGDRDPDATLLLMPHIGDDEVPLDPDRYGSHFALVGVREPFGPEHYSQPDEHGVHWFNPPDFHSK